MSPFTPERLLPLLSAFPQARCCWVAYSGGMDSEVLLYAVASLRERIQPEVRAVHLDHALHADSAAWAQRCRERCERLGVGLRVIRVDASGGRGESPEAAARRARYCALGALLEAGDLLLTAHHEDDQVETLLLALMRGSGPKGLSAMAEVSAFGVGSLLRPLLGFSRGELREFADHTGLDWLDDPSNEDIGYDRNFLRHCVLPLLSERWPAYGRTVARSARHCADAERLIEGLAQRQMGKVTGTRPATLSIAGVLKLDQDLARAVLRHWISGLRLPTPDTRHLARILDEVLTARPDAVPLVTWPGCEVRRYRDDLFAMAPLPPKPGPGSLQWRIGTLALPPELGRMTLLGPSERPIDPEQVFPGGLRIQFARKGLWCRPAGASHHRPLKKLFQEAGIPGWLRPYVPLTFTSEGLLSIGGFWMCGNWRTETSAEVHWEGGLRAHPGFSVQRPTALVAGSGCIQKGLSQPAEQTAQ